MEELFSFSTTELLSFFLIIPILVLIIIWKKNQNKSHTSNVQPPQPPKLPLIGNLHQLVTPLPHRRLAELAKIYGPLMQLQFGQVSAVVVSSPELAKQIFKHNDVNVSNRCRVSVADVVFYNRQDIGFAPYGEYWRQMRKICNLELFTSKRVQSFKSIPEQEISYLVTSIRSKVGLPINLSDMILSSINLIVAGFSVLDMFPSLRFVHVITRMKSRVLKLHKQADRLLEDIIKEHKSELKLLGGEQTHESNLLNVLLELQQNPDSPLTIDGIKAITLEMFIAGTDSSATILERAMSELMKSPSVMKKAQEEVRKVCVENGKLDESVIYELKFLKAILKETMRLHPPLTLLPRQCMEECKINGYNIKAKTEVLVNVWAIGRDPNNWIEPEKFSPERFINSDIDYKGCNFEFISFDAGRRMCPSLQMDMQTSSFL